MKIVLSQNTKLPKSPRDSSAGFKIQFFPLRVTEEESEGLV